MPRNCYQPEIALDLKKPESLYLQLRQAMIQDIFQRRPQAGTPMESERQLAERLQLNRNTVHQAMEHLVEERILQRESGKRGLTIGREATRRVQPPFPAIGIILPKTFSTYVMEQPVYLKTRLMYLSGIFDRAGELGYAPMPLSPGPESAELEVKKWEDQIQPRLTAVLHLGDRGINGDALLETIMQQSYLPQVSISCQALGTGNIGHISCDLTSALLALAQLLIEKGRRRLGIIGEIGGSNPYFSYEYAARTDHALAVFRQTGLEVRDNWVVGVPEGSFGDDALAEFFADRESWPDALWCSNDLLAAKVLLWLRKRGIDVPGRIALIGTDDIGSTGDLGIGLTSIKVPMYAIGRAAVDLGLEYYFHGHHEGNHVREFPGTLVIRQTT